MAALLSWLVCQGNAKDPLFQFQSGVPLTRARLVAELRRALSTRNTKNADRFSGHSFRSGVATTAAAHGIEDSQIKLLGRWRSGAYQAYIWPKGPQLARLAKCLSTSGNMTKRGDSTTQLSCQGNQRAHALAGGLAGGRTEYLFRVQNKKL